MTQLNKEQIDAVAEWLKQNVSTKRWDLPRFFEKDFSPKSAPPEKWCIKLDKNHYAYTDFVRWWRYNFVWDESLSDRYFYYSPTTDHKYINTTKEQTVLAIDMDKWNEWYGQKEDDANTMTKEKEPLPKITDLSKTKIWFGEDLKLANKIERAANKLGWKFSDGYIMTGKPTCFWFLASKEIDWGNPDKVQFDIDSEKEIFPSQILEDSGKKIDDFMWQEAEKNMRQARFNLLHGTPEKPKVYILQKDLPYTKAGAKFIYCPPTEDYIYSDEAGNVILRYDRAWMENNPEWFLHEEEAFFSVCSTGCNVIEVTKLTSEPWSDTLNRIIEADFLSNPQHKDK